MQYRKLPRGTEQVSVLGIGTSSIQASSEKEIEKIITAAPEERYFCIMGICQRSKSKRIYRKRLFRRK